MNKWIALLLLMAAVMGSFLCLGLAYAASTPQTTIKIYVHSVDGYPVPKAYADIVYSTGNSTVGPINFPATDGRGQANITFPVNQTLNARLNVTYLNVVVLENYNITLQPNTTQTFNLTVNIVNLTYTIKNPYGGILANSTILFKGLSNTNVSVSENTPNGSLLLPTGVYTVSAYRGPMFYNANISISPNSKVLNITAPLLTLKYVVIDVNGQPLQAQAVDLLYAGSLVNSAYTSSGAFSGLLPGYYQLVAYGYGLINSTTVGLGSNTTVYLVMPSGYRVAVKLSDEFGAPLVGYNVTLAGLKNYSNITGPSGIALFEGLPQGEYFIKVYHQGQLVFATTSYIAASGTQQLVISGYTGGHTPSAYIAVRLAFGFALLVLASLILLTNRAKTK